VARRQRRAGDDPRARANDLATVTPIPRSSVIARGHPAAHARRRAPRARAGGRARRARGRESICWAVSTSRVRDRSSTRGIALVEQAGRIGARNRVEAAFCTAGRSQQLAALARFDAEWQRLGATDEQRARAAARHRRRVDA
jgi:hypothetical protein